MPRAWVRAYDFGPPVGASATVVFVPGLGLPHYTFRTARVLSGMGLRCVVLDLLGGRRPERVPATVDAMAAAAAAWAGSAHYRGPLVLVGHSTGAQVALAAAVRLQDTRPDLSLVVAGLTFEPSQRPVRSLLKAGLTAYGHDSPREAVVVLPDLVHVRGELLRLIESGRHDEPDVRVRGLRVPLTLTAGEHDTFSPPAWMAAVAEAAGSDAVRVLTLPGSHNNLFMYPERFAAVVASSVGVGAHGSCSQAGCSGDADPHRSSSGVPSNR